MTKRWEQYWPWQNAEKGAVMDFEDALAAGDATPELKTYKVQEISFVVAATGLAGEAVFQIEVNTGAFWLALDATKITRTPDENNSANGLLVYDHCATVEGIRCRFVSVGGDPESPLVPAATVRARAAKLAD